MGIVAVTGVINVGWPLPTVTLTLYEGTLGNMTPQTPVTVQNVKVNVPFTQTWTVNDGLLAYVHLHLDNGVGVFDGDSNRVCVNCLNITLGCTATADCPTGFICQNSLCAFPTGADFSGVPISFLSPTIVNGKALTLICKSPFSLYDGTQGTYTTVTKYDYYSAEVVDFGSIQALAQTQNKQAMTLGDWLCANMALNGRYFTATHTKTEYHPCFPPTCATYQA